MSSELVTAVEVGRSLYVYRGDTLISSVLTHNSSMAETIAVVRSNSESFRHIKITYHDWDILLDWEDRVAKDSLYTLLESLTSRDFTVAYLEGQA